MNTQRCPACSREIKSWQRAEALAKLLIARSEASQSRIRFVTLTLPNYDCPHAGLADLKIKIRNFRYRRSTKQRVLGGCDFYEWTEKIDPVSGAVESYNVHYHGIWIGKFWDQKDLMAEWNHGGARIELVKKKHEANDCVRYCTKYLNKMKQLGLRSKQVFGIAYGDYEHTS